MNSMVPKDTEGKPYSKNTNFSLSQPFSIAYSFFFCIIIVLLRYMPVSDYQSYAFRI